MRLIATNTKLPDDKIPLLREAIARRRKSLAKLKLGQAEESLWLMTEIAHLEDLLEFNLKPS